MIIFNQNRKQAIRHCAL